MIRQYRLRETEGDLKNKCIHYDEACSSTLPCGGP